MTARAYRRGVVGIFLLFFLLPLRGNGAEVEPRAVSDAERAAVEFVAAHLSSGARALWDATGKTSRLRKLGADEGTREIALRVGPPEGSEWQLVTVAKNLAETTAAFRVTFPSGIDDTIIFDVVTEDGAYRIHDMRSMSDSFGTAPAAAAVPVNAAPAAVPAMQPEMMIAIVAVLLLGATAVLWRRQRRIARLVSIAAVLAFCVAGTSMYVRHRANASAATAVDAAALPAKPGSSRKLLAELRAEVARGDVVPAETFRRAARDPEAHDRALLWSAQIDYQQMKLEEATATLSKLKQRASIPLAHILEARIAFLNQKEVDTVMAYERAIDLGPERDDVQYEAASAMHTLGFEERAKGYFDRVARLGSREADAFYSLAVLEALKRDHDLAERYLMTGWRLRPATREELVRSGVLLEVMRRPSVARQFAFHQSGDPLLKAARFAENPVKLPASAQIRCIGELLEVKIGDCTILVAGGSIMAPPTAQIIDAATWKAEETQRAIVEAPNLIRVASQPSSYAQPALARKIERTAQALAEHNRWTELARLTEGISVRSDAIPPDLILLKIGALRRTRQNEQAARELREFVGSATQLKRLDAKQLLEAGEMLAAVGMYGVAIKLIERAGRLREMPSLDDRIRQLLLNQRLASSYQSHETTHFRFNFSPDVSATTAVRIGEIAEKELARLQKWIPTPTFEKVEVNILAWEEFRATYTGSDHILGFYDGKITIPFGGVGNFSPEVVSILSHELAHAMIAQKTNDQAPRWFQEGLAQRIESVPYARNAFNTYENDQLLALSLIDDVIAYSIEPGMMALGYIESHAVIRYLESTYGASALNTLMTAFGAGKTSEEALEMLAGKSLAAVEEDFRRWGTAKREIFTNTELVRYDTRSDQRIEFAARTPQ